MEFNKEQIETAQLNLTTATETPPRYLIATYLSLVGDENKVTAYCVSQDDGDEIRWTLVGCAGQRLIRLGVTGPSFDPYPAPGSSEQQATTTDAYVQPLEQAVRAVAVSVQMYSTRYSESFDWYRLWEVRFSDGSTFVFPTGADANSRERREQADRLAAALMAGDSLRRTGRDGR